MIVAIIKDIARTLGLENTITIGRVKRLLLTLQ